MRSLDLSNELFRIYLRDDSERANTDGISAITTAFAANLGTLFYKNANAMFKFCLSGAGFPISLPETRWRECIPERLREAGIYRFRNWAPPGIEHPVEHWIAIKLRTTSSEPSYLFLGKNETAWNHDDIESFVATAKIISEIVSIRFKREIEIKNRHEAEDALKLIQTRMTTFFESSHDTIYTLDTEERFTSINHAGLRLFGAESKDEIIGKPFSKFTTDSGAHRFFRERVREEGFIDDYEIVIKRVDGTQIYCLETAHTVTGDAGAIIEIQGTLKDISERIKNERELWAMNFELSKVNADLKNAQAMIVQQEKLASIGQLAAGVAHEINNPLGFLKSNQTMLKSYFSELSSTIVSLKDSDEKAMDAYRQGDLEYVIGEAGHIFEESAEGFERIRNIVSNLMTFSRSSSSDDFEEYDVNAGIESTLSVARNELKYTTEITKKLGNIPKVSAKQGEINQVILNILVNAAQAISGQKRKEKGNITIETTAVGGNVIITISDDGPGIPEEIRSKIFDPFFTTKEPGRGTGLGLSISYDIIVEKHKGSLSVTSEIGKGSCFKISLPITQGGKPTKG